MAKTVKSEDLRLNIIVNGDPLKKEIGSLLKKTRELAEENRGLLDEQKKLRKEGREESAEYAELTRRIEENGAAMQRNRARVGELSKQLSVNDKTIVELRRHIRDLNRQLNNLDPKSKEWEEANRQLAEAKERLRELRSHTDQTGSALDRITQRWVFFAAKVSVAIGVIRSIGGLFSEAMGKIREFEQANVNLSTILGVSVSQIGALTRSALELGRTTEYTASQVTGLQTELAKLGFGQGQILKMQKPILEFATAMGAELPEAAALAGATLRAFGLDADAADDVLGTMAVSANKSALSFSYLNESMSIVAPVAKTFGFGIKDTVALLGTLANSGFDASSAATATRNILLNLADANGKLARELGGPVRTLPELIDGLNRLNGRGVDLAKTLELTDKRSVAAFNTFLRGADAMGELRGEVEDVDGELRRISEERLQTVEGQSKMLASAWEGLMLSFFNSKGVIRSVIEGLTGLVEGATKLVKGSDPLIDQYDAQLDRVASLQDEIPGLVSEYETLRGKTELNADEQDRLKTVTEQLAAAYPGAITAVNEYGEAVGINTAKVTEFLEAEKARLQFMNATAIEELEDTIVEQERLISRYQKWINDGFRLDDKRGPMGPTLTKTLLTPEEIADLRKRIAQAQQTMQGAKEQVKRLNGETLDEQIRAAQARREAAEQAAGEDRKSAEQAAEVERLKQERAAAAQAAYKALDEKELAERIAIRKAYLDGEIATEQEYNDRLLQLNIDSLKRRLQSDQLAGKERLTAQEQLTTLLIQQQEERQKRFYKSEEERIKTIADAEEREVASYDLRKRQYAGDARMLEQLEAQHSRNIAKIRLGRIDASLKADEEAYKQERQALQKRHGIELAEIARSKEERRRLKQQQAAELAAFDEEYFRAALERLRQLRDEGTSAFVDLEGVLRNIDLDTSLLSEQDKEALLRRIREVSAEWDAVRGQIEELARPEEKRYTFHVEEEDERKNRSIFGVAQSDWDLFFENLENGKFGAEELKVLLQGVAGAAEAAFEIYAGYDKMMTAKENAELRKYKKSQDAKKKSLQTRLDAGLISQQQYDDQVARMEAEYDKKQEELEIKQAKRQKAQSLGQAAIATALAVAKALPNLVLAALAGAMGAAQIALIAATPIAGAERGGMIVTRAQDGRRFNAAVEPDRRGYVARPTVITGENGLEYVVPNEAMRNPTARPVIDLFESVRRRGRLADFNFAEVLPALYGLPGRAGGGMISPGSSPEAAGTTASAQWTAVGETDLREIIGLLQQLLRKADEPTPAVVSMLGKGGFVEVYERYLKLKRNGQLG